MSARLLVLAALFAGCSPAPDASSPTDGASRVELTAADSGQTLALGQRVTVALASNPSTGYRWALTDSVGGALVQDGEPAYVQDVSAPGMVGVGGRETWTFQAALVGSGTLRLVYRRPSEPDDASPPDSFSVPVVVR